MPDHRLKPIPPLGGDMPRTDRFEGLTITENPDLALASVACRPGQGKSFGTAAKKALGFALPGPGQTAAKGDYTAFWTGPEQWMLGAPFASHEDIAAILKRVFKATASVTEQTDGWARFDLNGSAAPVVFERLCNLNTRAMASGSATRTVIDHLGCFVICRAAGTDFSVLGPRSSAGSLHHAMTTAATSALG
ncbi:MAG: sarcosine oxidase subunit gamma [Paracoccaceae bacterium]